VLYVCAQVLFQNDSLATLLARVVGILGPIDPELLRKGRDTHKFFTKNHRLYERNQVRAAMKVSWCEFEYVLMPEHFSSHHVLVLSDWVPSREQECSSVL